MTNLSLFGHELVVDNFAGGGGASEGIEQALGRPVDLAINHDATAIAVHTANHPGAEHSVADVWDIDPEQAVHGMPVGLAWFSPDCRHHSKAKGGRPVSKSVRGLAWVAARWAAKVKPRVIALENVEEFLDWGPLIKGADGKARPDPARKGETFRGFVRALRRHGYEVDWRILRACDYGAPTIRQRLILGARRDGLPLHWPAPTHGDPASLAVRRGKLLPWESAASCIDWSIPCPSIFDRARPLADATLRRIARGVMRFVVEAEDPFIAPITQAARPAGAHLVAAFLAKHYTGVIGADLRQPLPTITATDHNALVAVSLVNLKGSDRGGRDPRQPMPTVCAGDTHVGAVAAFLVKYYGRGIGQPCSDPLHTTPTRDRFGLVTVTLSGEQYAIVDIGMRMLQPHELSAGQGFPDGYQFAEAGGRAVPKYQQVRLIGNSVCPPLARAYVEANFTHERRFMPAPAGRAVA
ncbi:DNA cytosine methyltransferase [Halomonas koreensis]|uniref:DNA (cytosine-5-)-methyltransferase n=1 Tax=Halomonas koreensis TaxID=245385 RepID=A0ABU1G3I5_9GAMM|nr:DNA cytosine methyltransferase [Halomonas koreensis]MDR5867256.1 DNA cytosine methyltransferase [Halomonas koreensis]